MRKEFFCFQMCVCVCVWLVSLLVLVSPLPLSAATKSVANIALGEIIAINGQQFVKIDNDGVKGSRFLALEQFSWQKTFAYTGNVQTLTAPYAGAYRIEVWGAAGGYGGGAKGGYTAGDINLNVGETLYIYNGGAGIRCVPGTNPGGYNGGGQINCGNTDGGTGGGASDVRLSSGEWNDAASLRSRIMVASGGGGGGAWNGPGGPGGGLTGWTGKGSWRNSNGYNEANGSGGTQTAGGLGGAGTTAYNGSFGQGGAGNHSGGGGGYYGGGGGQTDAGGGGSSYISGHTGSVAITSAASQTPKAGCTTGTSDIDCSTHYSGKVFTRTVMIDGNGYGWNNARGSQVPMPSPSGSSYAVGTGHAGDGVVKVTLISRFPCPVGCATCSDATTCQTCSAGYLKSGNTCVLANNVVTGCGRSDGAACTGCGAGYYFTSGSCSSCLANCATCSDTASCQTCNAGYLKSGNACVAAGSVVAGCTASNGTTCTSCAAGRYYATGTCPTCPANCSSCNNATTCTACASGYTLSGGQCVMSCNVANCASCSSSNYCASCNGGYYASGGSCYQNQCNVSYCTGCSSHNYCSSCQSGYYVSAGKCYMSCSVAGCNSCSSPNYCSACQAGYTLSGGVCNKIPCADENCILCTSSAGGACFLCDEEHNYFERNGHCETTE